MIRKIQTDDLVVSVSDAGAELQSIFSKRDNIEYLWQAKTPHWQGRAPILFPIVGRLKNGSYSYKGNTYSMEKHGFARRSVFTCVKEENSKLVYAFSDTPETLAMYPFRFELQVTYSLSEACLEIEYLVKNPSDKELLFGIGSHEGFCCPRGEGEGFEDYYLEFESGTDELQSTLLSKDGFVTDDTFPVVLQKNCLALDYQLFGKYDTLLFEGIKNRQVSIKSKKQQSYVEVTYDAPNLAVWTQPGAPFICIEPWHGLPDHVGSDGNFADKKANICLQPNESISFYHKIRVVS